jgi:hypothetical protein
MDKTLKIAVSFLVLLFVGIIFLDSRKPKPIDWTPTYSIKDKIPFGLYVLDQEMGRFFKGQEIEKINKSPYEYFIDQYNFEDKINKGHYINGTFINIVESSDIDKESAHQILQFVGAGNAAFISAKDLPAGLLDTLKLEIKAEFKLKDSIFNWLANKKTGRQKYKLIEGVGNNYFSKIDTINTTVLGYQSGDSVRVNFIKIKFDKGFFYLHTQPAAFTNFHLLKGNHYQYAEKVLSYLPKTKLLWYLKDQNGVVIDDSPLSYIFSKPALKCAWLTFIFGMFFFMVFNAKRKQRIVPIIKPLPNTTIDFTKTIGNLYYQEGDHDTIINKKIIYFLEKIRGQYLLDTSKLDDDFIKKLAQKSGKKPVDIQNVVFLINNYRRSPHNSVEEDLIAIDTAIEKVV